LRKGYVFKVEMSMRGKMSPNGEEQDMAGHSKWHNIQQRKGVEDAKRGKVFSELSKLIRVAVREHKSGDPKFNSTLRMLLEKARAANMPKENIQRAIDRGLGKGTAGVIQEIVYEGYGPGGVGFVIVAQTDNTQRTAGEVRFALSRAGGTLGGPGSVMFMFKHEGEEYVPTIPMEISDPEQQQTLQKLIDTLRNDQDVEDVFCAGVWEGKE
jgi:transcriptional/translational regulatory protein YebC/TACO1